MGRTDIGPPDFHEMLPDVIKKNYGTWKYHEIPRPGVLKHVAESGDTVYTVRAGSPRLVSVDFIRDICDNVLAVYLSDTVKARRMLSSGSYQRRRGEGRDTVAACADGQLQSFAAAGLRSYVQCRRAFPNCN